MNESMMKSRKSIIMLKVTLDWRVKCIFHNSITWVKGIKAALALKQLRNLYQETEHQLDKINMALTVDHQAIIWFLGVSKIALSQFD